MSVFLVSLVSSRGEGQKVGRKGTAVLHCKKRNGTGGFGRYVYKGRRGEGIKRELYKVGKEEGGRGRLDCGEENVSTSVEGGKKN
jgi:hypothetical protein